MDIIQAINASAECRRKVRAFRFPVDAKRSAEAVRLFGVGMFNIFTADNGALSVTWTAALEADAKPYTPPAPPADVCTLCCGSGVDEQSGYSGGKFFRASSIDVCPVCSGTGKPQRVVVTEQHIAELQNWHEAVA